MHGLLAEHRIGSLTMRVLEMELKKEVGVDLLGGRLSCGGGGGCFWIIWSINHVCRFHLANRSSSSSSRNGT
jgi:hypothetical protein